MSDSLSCERFVGFLRAFMDDDLPADVHTAFAAHMKDCPPCEDYLDGYRRSVGVAQSCSVPKSEPPEALISAILAATCDCPNARGGNEKA